MTIRMSCLVISLLFSCVGVLAQGSTVTAEVSVSAPTAVARELGGDLFIAGSNVRVAAALAGDLFALGGNVDVDAPIGGDAVLAGGNLRIGADVAQSIYAGGGQLVIDASVGRNLRVAGGRVELGPRAVVGGNLSVGGGQVTLRGRVKGFVQIAGGSVLLDGPVDGDVVSTAGQLELGPNARLAGSLRYAGRDEIKRDPAAQVAGAIERMPLRSAGSDAREDRRERRTGFRGGWIWTVGLMLLAGALVAALPGTSGRVADALRARPAMALLLGFVVLVCIPIALLLLLVTVIGAPLALLGVLLYLALLLVGYVASGVAFGAWALRRVRPDAASQRGWRVGAAMLAMLAIALLARAPWIGGFVVLVAMLMGIGAIALQWRSRDGTPPLTGGAA